MSIKEQLELGDDADASDPMGTVGAFFGAMMPFAIGGIGDSQIPSAMEGTIAGPQAAISTPSPGVNVTNTLRPNF